MIGKLKLRCGSQFSGKMEGMLNDLAIGVDHQSDFEAHVKEAKTKDLGKVEFSVQGRTTGYWPTYQGLDVHLPPGTLGPPRRAPTLGRGWLGRIPPWTSAAVAPRGRAAAAATEPPAAPLRC